MKTAISIPDDLFSAAEFLAEKLGISRSQLYQQAIHQYLAQQGHEAVTEALNAVYGEGRGSGKLDPSIEYLQGASLVREDGQDEW